MPSADVEFREFALGFVEPLARLAYVVTTEPESANDLAVSALARVRRRWHDVASTGSPEQAAVEELARLARRRHRLANAPRAVEAAEVADDDPVAALVWRAWSALSPQQRFVSVLVDPSAVSPRLTGLDTADIAGALAARRSLPGLLDGARQALVGAAHADARWPALVAERAELADPGGVEALLAEVLRARAGERGPVVDPLAVVATRVRAARRRSSLIAVVVVVVIGVLATAVVHVSGSSSSTTSSSASNISIPRSSPAPQPALVSPAVSGTPPVFAGPTATFSIDAGTGQLVSDGIPDWPTRGNAADDLSLLVNVRALFLQAFPNVTGQVHVLAVQDTPTFRLAYVAADTSDGVATAWFYGPPGSDQLVQGQAMMTAPIGTEGVLAAVVSVQPDDAQLVVIAPPSTSAMRIAEAAPATPGSARTYSPLAQTAGFAVRDVSHSYEPDIEVEVDAGGKQVFAGPAQSVDLLSSTLASGLEVLRGTPDPQLLTQAYQVAQEWETTGELTADAVPLVLWGGTDGTVAQVVVRMRTLHLVDLLIVAWGGPHGDADAELLAPDSPNFPVSWDYTGADGPHAAALVPTGAASARLMVDGRELPPVRVDSDGYVSLPITGQTGLLADQTLQIELFDSAGHLVRTVGVPPTA